MRVVGRVGHCVEHASLLTPLLESYCVCVCVCGGRNMMNYCYIAMSTIVPLIGECTCSWVAPELGQSTLTNVSILGH